MNKNCMKTAGAGVVLVFAMDFVFHGLLMKGIYQASPQLWRAPETMGAYLPYMSLGQVLMALMMAAIFAKGYHGGGWREGLRFGLFFGALDAGKNLITYAVVPYDLSLILAWTGIAFFESIVLGLVFAKIRGSNICESACAAKN